MMDLYGANGKRCWSNFFNLCLQKGTIFFELKIQDSQQQEVTKELESWVFNRLPKEVIPAPLVNEAVNESSPSTAPLLATSEETRIPGN